MPVGELDAELEALVAGAVEVELVAGAGEVELVAGAGEVEVLAAGVGVAVVGVADGVAEGDALADALTACRGWQDWLVPGAVAATALPLRAATTPPEAAVSRALPAIKVTALRRPCAIRILIHID